MTLPSTLRTVPFFSQLRESDLELLAHLLEPRKFPRNRVVLFAHDPCDAFYVVVSGQVKVMLIAEDGREVILSLMQPGDFFGEMALMDEEPYAESAIAMEDSELLLLRRDEFRRCITEIPEMTFGLLRAMSPGARTDGRIKPRDGLTDNQRADGTEHIEMSGDGITILTREALERSAGQLLRRRPAVRKERRERGDAARPVT